MLWCSSSLSVSVQRRNSGGSRAFTTSRLNSRPRLYETYMTQKCAVKSACSKTSSTSQSASSVCRAAVKIERVALQKQTAAN
ncbi:uncharacterized [Tachysurus ichikawai]